MNRVPGIPWRSDQIIDEAKEQARVEADRLVTAAKAEVDQQVNRIREELRGEVVDLALMSAKKLLASSVDAKDHKNMVKKLVKEI